jgi:hypothetical protein
VADLAAFLFGDVAAHGEGFEVDLGGHDGGAETEHGAAFEVFDLFREDEEVAVAGFSGGGTVEVGVFVEDVVADPDVDGDGDVGAPGGGVDAEVFVGEVGFVDAAADVFAEAFVAVGGVLDPGVEFAGFGPEAEFAGADVAGDAFGGGADAGEVRSRGWRRRRSWRWR